MGPVAKGVSYSGLVASDIRTVVQALTATSPPARYCGP